MTYRQMKLPIFQIDAFASKTFKGNPAAVVPLEEWLPEDTMQAIAQENNLAETAFFVPTAAGFELRWFTPVAEVDLCGHATLATSHVIFNNLGYDEDEIHFNSKSGPLVVRRDDDLLALDFPSRPGEKCAIPEAIVEALGKAPLELFKTQDYMAVYESEQDIREIDPDFRLLKQLDLRGVMITAAGREADFVSRFFAPKYGIDEDPVTGSAHCTLIPYWAARLGKNKLTAMQLSKRTGKVFCEAKGERVKIAGHTIEYMQGTITA